MMIQVVVFSQWTSMLDLVETGLKRADILRTERQRDEKSASSNSFREAYRYRRLDGTMSQAQRTAALQTFNENDDVRILLVSLRSADFSRCVYLTL